MEISLNWLKQYIDIPLMPEQISELLTDLGLEVEGMKEAGPKTDFAGIVVGFVKECAKHPDADRLSVTKVDIGNGELLNIVCGGPNIAQGQKVIVATPGAKVFDREGKLFTIKKGNIRGAESNGMICAVDELGLGNDHSGVLVLPAETPIGMPARDYFKIEKDYVFEIGLTPNRSDATNHIGVARDIAARLRVSHQMPGQLRLPDVSAFQLDETAAPLDVVVENTTACPRYSGVLITGVQVGESPDWLKQRLSSIGIRAINNIVDITNFILHELGQPLHAFDLDEIRGRKVIVKTLPEGTRFVSLDEVERTLSAEDLMICDGESNPMCIGGVFGGIRSGVKETTTNIFLESAHFHPKWIRRSSTRHLLRTEAARIFEKGSDPNNTVYALKRAALLIKELCGGKIASEIMDIYPKPIAKAKVTVSYRSINRLIGIAIPAQEVKTILAALEMDIVSETPDSLTIQIPTNKADVLREADVIEEILRIYGYNVVPIPNQIRSAIVLGEEVDKRKVQNTIGDYLVANGFYEMMAMSLTQSKYYREFSPQPETALVYVNNTSNVHLDIMRPSLLYSALEAVVHNQNRQQSDVRLFEFGKSYHKEGEDYLEQNHLAVTMSGQRFAESWLNKDKTQVTFFALKTYVNGILAKLGLKGYQESALESETFQFGLKYHRGPQTLVTFGKVQGSVSKKMDIRQHVFFADFQWDNILKSLKNQQIKVEELTKFPTVRRDLALVIENSVNFADIVQIAQKSGKKLLKEINLFDVFEDEQKLGKGKKSYAVSFLFEDPNRTLQDKEVDGIMSGLIEAYQEKIHAQIRR